MPILCRGLAAVLAVWLTASPASALPPDKNAALPPDIAATLKQIDQASLPFSGNDFTPDDAKALTSRLQTLMEQVRQRAPQDDPEAQKILAKLQAGVDKISRSMTDPANYKVPLMKTALGEALSAIKKNTRGLAKTFPAPAEQNPNDPKKENTPAADEAAAAKEKDKDDPAQDISALQQQLEGDPNFAKNEPNTVGFRDNSDKLNKVQGAINRGDRDAKSGFTTREDDGNDPGARNAAMGNFAKPAAADTTAADVKRVPANQRANADFIAASVVGSAPSAAIAQAVAAAKLILHGSTLINNQGQSPTDQELEAFVAELKANKELSGRLASTWKAQSKDLEKELMDIGLDKEALVWLRSCVNNGLQTCNPIKANGERYVKGRALSMEEIKKVLDLVDAKQADGGHAQRMLKLKSLGRKTRPVEGEFPREDARTVLQSAPLLQANAQSLGMGAFRPGDISVNSKDDTLRQMSYQHDVMLKSLAACRKGPLPEEEMAWLESAGRAELETWLKQVMLYYEGLAKGKADIDSLVKAEKEASEFLETAARLLSKATESWAADFVGASKNGAGVKEEARRALAALPEQTRADLAKRLDDLREKLLKPGGSGAAAALDEFFDNAVMQVAYDDPVAAGYLRLVQRQYHANRGEISGKTALAALAGPGAPFALGTAQISAAFSFGDAAAFALDALPMEDLLSAAGIKGWAQERLRPARERLFELKRKELLEKQREAFKELASREVGRVHWNLLARPADEETFAEYERTSLPGRLSRGLKRRQELLNMAAQDPDLKAVIDRAAASVEGDDNEVRQKRIVAAVRKADPELAQAFDALERELADAGARAKQELSQPLTQKAEENFQKLREEYHALLLENLAQGTVPEGALLEGEDIGLQPGQKLYVTRLENGPDGKAIRGYWIVPKEGGRAVFMDFQGQQLAVSDLSADNESPGRYAVKLVADPADPKRQVAAYMLRGRWNADGQLIEGNESFADGRRVSVATRPSGVRVTSAYDASNRRTGRSFESWQMIVDPKTGAQHREWVTLWREEPNLLHIDPRYFAEAFDSESGNGLVSGFRHQTLRDWLERHKKEVESGQITAITLDAGTGKMAVRYGEQGTFRQLYFKSDDRDRPALIEEYWHEAREAHGDKRAPEIFAYAVYSDAWTSVGAKRRYMAKEGAQFKERDEVLKNGEFAAAGDFVYFDAKAAKASGGRVQYKSAESKEDTAWDVFGQYMTESPFGAVGKKLYGAGDALLGGVGGMASYLGGANLGLQAEILQALGLSAATGAADYADILKINGFIEFQRATLGQKELEKKARTPVEILRELKLQTLAEPRMISEASLKWFLGEQRRVYVAQMIAQAIAEQEQLGALFTMPQFKNERQRVLQAMFSKINEGLPTGWELIEHEAFARFVVHEGAGAAGGLREISELGHHGKAAAEGMGWTIDFGKNMAGGQALGAATQHSARLAAKLLAGNNAGKGGLDWVLAQMNRNVGSFLKKGGAGAAEGSTAGDVARTVFGSARHGATTQALAKLSSLDQALAMEGRMLLLSQAFEIPVNTIQMVDTVMTTTLQIGQGDMKNLAQSIGQQAAFVLYGRAAEFGPSPKKRPASKVAEPPSPVKDANRIAGSSDAKRPADADPYRVGEGPKVDPAQKQKAVAEAEKLDKEHLTENAGKIARRIFKKGDPEELKAGEERAGKAYDEALKPENRPTEAEFQKAQEDGLVHVGLPPKVSLQDADAKTCTMHALVNHLRAQGIEVSVKDVLDAAQEHLGKVVADKISVQGLGANEMISVYQALAQVKGFALKSVQPHEFLATIAREGRGAMTAIETGQGWHAVYVEGVVMRDGKPMVSIIDSLAGGRIFMPAAEFGSALRLGGYIADAKGQPHYADQMEAFRRDMWTKRQASNVLDIKRELADTQISGERRAQLENRLKNHEAGLREAHAELDEFELQLYGKQLAEQRKIQKDATATEEARQNAQKRAQELETALAERETRLGEFYQKLLDADGTIESKKWVYRKANQLEDRIDWRKSGSAIRGQEPKPNADDLNWQVNDLKRRAVRLDREYAEAAPDKQPAIREEQNRLRQQQADLQKQLADLKKAPAEPPSAKPSVAENVKQKVQDAFDGLRKSLFGENPAPSSPLDSLPDQAPKDLNLDHLADHNEIAELAKIVDSNPDMFYRGLGIKTRAELDTLLRQIANGGMQPELGMTNDPLAPLVSGLIERALAQSPDFRFRQLFPEGDAALRETFEKARFGGDDAKAKAKLDLEKALRRRMEAEIKAEGEKASDRWFKNYGSWATRGSPVPRNLIQFVYKGGENGQGAGSSLSFAVQKSRGADTRYVVLFEIDPQGLKAEDVSAVRKYAANPQEFFILGKIPPGNIKSVWINGRRYALSDLVGSGPQ